MILRYLLPTLLALALAGCATTTEGPVIPTALAPAEVVVDEAGARKTPSATTRLVREFDTSATGSGSRRIGRVDVQRNAGTIEVDGREIKGFIYDVQDWDEYGYVLYDFLAVDAGQYYVLYLYCRDGALTDIYWESFADDLQYEKMFGACSRLQETTESQVSWDPVSSPREGLVVGYEIEGDNLHLGADGRGTLTLMDHDYEIHAFSYVGCGDCLSDGRVGWEELHIMMDMPDEDCFGILYLYGKANSPYPGQTVQLGYGFCTNPVKDLPNTMFTAVWSHTEPSQ